MFAAKALSLGVLGRCFLPGPENYYPNHKHSGSHGSIRRFVPTGRVVEKLNPTGRVPRCLHTRHRALGPRYPLQVRPHAVLRASGFSLLSLTQARGSGADHTL